MFATFRTLLQRWLGSAPTSTQALGTAMRAHSTSEEAEVIHAAEHHLLPYDENLFERARTQWQFGDWASLAKLDRDALQHHPDRAKLVLLAAAGHLQEGDTQAARQFTRLAHDWGCSKKLISQILIAGVHNSLGRAAAVAGQHPRAVKHFENAIAIGAPASEIRLLTQARAGEQLTQLGLPANSIVAKVGATATTIAVQLPPIGRSIEELANTIKQQKADLQTELKKHQDEIASFRKLIDSSVHKEIYSATKQLRSYLGVQNYLNTGELTGNMNDWAICSDLALWLIELLETHDYDLVIEFGSGTSTTIIAKTLAKIAMRRGHKPSAIQLAFEHLEKYHTQTLTNLRQAELENIVQVHLAPLIPYTPPNGDSYSYYDCHKTLTALSETHTPAFQHILVVVDGPPGITGKHARYPALPSVLGTFTHAKFDFILDDYERIEEREVAEMWQSDLRSAGFSPKLSAKKMEKDACLISFSTLVQ